MRSTRTLMSLAVASACSLAAAVTPLSAYAQAGAAAADPNNIPAAEAPTLGPTNGGDQIPEVKVTATRYSTSLLRTPLAVSAFSQEQLTRKGATSLRDLANEIPNVVIESGSLDSAVQVTIRGITSTNFTETGDPAVGFHVDGMYSPRPQGAQALMFDIDQVEVLRGPQGTLFGRNSTGGSINVISAKPDFSGNYGKANVDIGNYRKKQVSAVQNIAVSDKLALRGTFMIVQRDGYANQMRDMSEANAPEYGWVPNGKPDVDQRFNAVIGKDKFYTNQDQWAARLSALYKVNQDVTLKAAYEHFQDNGAGGADFRDCAATAGTRYACAPGTGKWDLLINVPGAVDMQIRTLRTGLSWTISPDTTFDYTFQVADQKRSEITDDDRGMQHAAPFQVNGMYPNTTTGNWGTWPIKDVFHRTLDSRYFSTVHEAQLKQTFGPLQYVAGLFWMHERNSIDYEMTETIQKPFGDVGSVLYHQPNRQVDAKAAFAQADWKFAPGWTGTLGARYSSDSKEDKGGEVYGANWIGSSNYYNGLYSQGTPGTPGFRVHDGTDLTPAMGGSVGAYHLYGAPTSNDHKETWKKVTWRVGLQKQFNPNQMGYASVSTGYKAGGFADKTDSCNYQLCADGQPGVVTFLPYGPETVTNFELGYKGKFLDNRLSLSATAFFMKYKDMQLTGTYFINQIIPAAGLPCPSDQPKCDVYEGWRTINVGKVDIPGLEIEWDYRPWRGARFGGGFAFINTDVHDFREFSDDYQCDVRVELGIEPCPTAYAGPDKALIGRRLYNVDGNHLPNTPKYQVNLNFSQEFALAGGYRLTPYVKVNWRDKAYFDMRNSEFAHIGRYQKAYAMGDVSARLDSPNDKWYAELYVRNVSDSHAAKNRDSVNGGFMKANFVEPRMFGVRLGAEY
ncbi:TonB-dependent receptor [Pseudoduganella umbonata]|uniref:Iron complex outermembrane receptor protein n=1 Tax=Pseudoduganella umbonata TaxID=864828 RepID=A0A4P8HRG8_9BURK|nr:TonB-dependent receptor [Pseudoduganella umbonata]MBB3224769.1 iron complex outermembrane receptor protein [Pseudoduganella umbonata]QCP11080.1 TonB-dependent receptor [Pseudoduganella umbonata]